MQAIQLRLLLSLCAVTLTTMAVADTTTDAQPSDAAPKSASEPKQQRQTDVFKPTEQISEDFAAPMPVDI